MPEADVAIGLYLLLGAFAGLTAGLLGVGGGLIIVPALASIYVLQGIAPQSIMHLALGTSLATIVITSISSVIAHHRHQAVLWPVFWQLTPGILLGAWFGGWLAGQITTDWLKPIFGLFELSVAAYMLLGKSVTEHSPLPGTASMTSAGGVIGGLSAIVGIGGGTLTVPFLCWNSIPCAMPLPPQRPVACPSLLPAHWLIYSPAGSNRTFPGTHWATYTCQPFSALLLAVPCLPRWEPDSPIVCRLNG